MKNTDIRDKVITDIADGTILTIFNTEKIKRTMRIDKFPILKKTKTDSKENLIYEVKVILKDGTVMVDMCHNHEKNTTTFDVYESYDGKRYTFFGGGFESYKNVEGVCQQIHDRIETEYWTK